MQKPITMQSFVAQLITSSLHASQGITTFYGKREVNSVQRAKGVCHYDFSQNSDIHLTITAINNQLNLEHSLPCQI